MSPPKRRVSRVLVIQIASAMSIFLAFVFIYRELRHQRLNHELTVAIAHEKNERAIELLQEGADGTATEGDESVTISTVLHHFIDRFLHKSQQGPGAKTGHRLALLLYYETGRDRENRMLTGDMPPLDERLPLLLLDRGAPCDEVDSERYSVVYWAAHFHNHNVLRKLVELGANVNTSVVAIGDTPLMQADDTDTEILLSHGAHPNAAGFGGETALFAADAPKAELLLAAGAKVDVVDEHHDTPLIDACKAGLNASVLVLVNHHSSVSARGRFGQTTLILAAATCKLETVQALVKAGADIHARDRFGTTALMTSLDNPDNRVFNWLLYHNLDVNLVGIGGQSALTIAMQKCNESTNDSVRHVNYIKVVDTLRSRGAKPVKTETRWYGEDVLDDTD